MQRPATTGTWICAMFGSFSPRQPVIQLVMRGMAESLGCRVQTVSNGYRRSRFQDNVYEIFLMDCQIRRRRLRSARPSGMESTGMTVRNRPAVSPRIPIIAVTAHAMEGDRNMHRGRDGRLFEQAVQENPLERPCEMAATEGIVDRRCEVHASSPERAPAAVQPKWARPRSGKTIDREVLATLRSLQGEGSRHSESTV